MRFICVRLDVAWVHQVFTPVAPYRYLLPNVYLQISQIQTCLCVVVGLGFVLTSPALKRSSA